MQSEQHSDGVCAQEGDPAGTFPSHGALLTFTSCFSNRYQSIDRLLL